MVKASKNDVRYALKDILKNEMKKEHKAELEKKMVKAMKESYMDNCPYCHDITEVWVQNEGSHIETIEKKDFIVSPCKSCKKLVYARIIMQPPASMLGSESFAALFMTEDRAKGKEIKRLQGGVFKTG